MRARLFVVLLVLLVAVPAFAQIPYANPAAAGIEVLVPERLMFDNDVTNQGNWEPYTSAFGDGTLCLAANTEELGAVDADSERVVVAFFNTDGTVQEVPGFYYSVSPAQPWNTNNDNIRKNGNPPRIAADKRAGATKYLVGNECTPWDFPDLFPTWGAGWSYSGTVASCQLFNKTASGPSPIGPVIDPVNGTATSGSQLDAQRYGGEIRALSNGNFISVVENRDAVYSSTTRAAVGSIVSGDTGLVIGAPFNTNLYSIDTSNDIWSGVAAFNGGFAVKGNMGSPTDFQIFFFDNAGTAKGGWQAVMRTDPATPLAPAGGFSTSVTETGRGDSFRLDSDIRNNYVYYAGKGISSPTGASNMGVYVTKIDANSRTTVKEAYVNEGCTTTAALGGPDRVNVCVDENGTVFVCWGDKSNTGLQQIAGRFYDSDLEPLSDPFLVYTSSEANAESMVKGFAVACPSCAMMNGRLLVACRTDAATSDDPMTYDSQDQIAIVLKVPMASSVKGWSNY